MATPRHVDERDPPVRRLDDNLVLRLSAGDDLQIDSMQQVSRTQLTEELRAKLCGFVNLVADIAKRLGEAVVLYPGHAPTLRQQALIRRGSALPDLPAAASGFAAGTRPCCQRAFVFGVCWVAYRRKDRLMPRTTGPVMPAVVIQKANR